MTRAAGQSCPQCLFEAPECERLPELRALFEALGDRIQAVARREHERDPTCTKHIRNGISRLTSDVDVENCKIQVVFTSKPERVFDPGDRSNNFGSEIEKHVFDHIDMTASSSTIRTRHLGLLIVMAAPLHRRVSRANALLICSPMLQRVLFILQAGEPLFGSGWSPPQQKRSWS